MVWFGPPRKVLVVSKVKEKISAEAGVDPNAERAAKPSAIFIIHSPYQLCPQHAELVTGKVRVERRIRCRKINQLFVPYEDGAQNRLSAAPFSGRRQQTITFPSPPRIIFQAWRTMVEGRRRIAAPSVRWMHFVRCEYETKAERYDVLNCNDTILCPICTHCGH